MHKQKNRVVNNVQSGMNGSTRIRSKKAMYENTKGRVVVGSGMSNEFQVNIGLRQGSALSALLFISVDLTRFLTRLPSKQELRWLRTRKPLAYRESTCTNLSVSCPYEIIVYSVLKHINTARMHTISRQFIPLIYCSLGKTILSKIQPILPFH